jgi:exodeoxyribonuclease V gamma subunit
MPLNLFASNRLELLAEDLAATLSRPLSSPLEPEIIVVQSRGMERWLCMELAKKQGICANIRFPFPNTLVNEIFAVIAAESLQNGGRANGRAVAKSYDPEFMTWRIMKLLPGCLDRSAFSSLRRYLAEPRATLKRLQLSARVADLFDQYLLFRPRMTAAWERGEELHWQAQLWRAVVEEITTPHRAALGSKFMQAIHDGNVASSELPSRICVFGISALPEFHLQMLNAVSTITEVNFFLMNPCREYWGDIVSDRDIARIAKRNKSSNVTLDLFHLEKGNSLLASMGKLGRDFFDLIEEKFNLPTREKFEDPGDQDLLTHLQSDILNLKEANLTDVRRAQIEPADRSVQIHSCHSPRREIEVLHNALLELFENDSALKPSDILVMAPDIEPHVPYIQAVFDLSYDDPRRIPFSIADRSYQRENPIVDTFFAVLDLYGSRFTASRVLSILESPAVCKKFQISEDDLGLIQTWTQGTRIRWGRDAEHRGELGLPDYPQNTWRAGLDRLLLGYALPGQGEKLYENTILPYDHIEGSQASALGKLLEFTESLFDRTESLRHKRDLDAWSTALMELLELFVEPETEGIAEMEVVQRTLGQLKDFQQLNAFDEELDFPVIRHYLDGRLNQEGYGYGFLSGGVTFCSMLPMRSIPAKIICLIGMNHDSYPRQTKQLGFDLIAKQPKRGDRSRRNDDRYLFLEALLSARSTFYVSFVGQSIKDNSAIPASVVVEELADYIAANFEMDDEKLRAKILTSHRLQAFSPEYFKEESRLFSYSSENLQAAKLISGERSHPKPFISEDSLGAPDEESRTVSLVDLYRFFRNPTRFLLNKRLNLYLTEDVDIFLDEEPFALRGLDRYDVAQQLLQKGMTEETTTDLKSSVMAAGQLPHGAIGEYEYRELSEQVECFVEKTCRYAQETELEPLTIDMALNGFHITGKIDQINRQALTAYRFARVRAKDHLKAWLNHLLLNIVQEPGYPSTSFLAGINSMREASWTGWTFNPAPNSAEILNQLLQVYWRGMTGPIPFFPDSALSFAVALNKGKKPESAIGAARKIWHGSEMERGEKEDPYFMHCFGDRVDPLTESFQTLAQQIWWPILNHQQEIDPC